MKRKNSRKLRKVFNVEGMKKAASGLLKYYNGGRKLPDPFIRRRSIRRLVASRTFPWKEEGEAGSGSFPGKEKKKNTRLRNKENLAGLRIRDY